MDVEKTIEHLLSLQAGHDARIQILEEKQAKSVVLTNQLIGLMSQLANRQAKDAKELREAQKKTDAQIRETHDEIKALSTVVRAYITGNGRKN